MAKEKKNHRLGHCLRSEPESKRVLVEDQTVMDVFSKEACLKFYEKLQGGHTQVSKEFSLHFSGTTTKVGMLNMSVTPKTIALVTEITRG